MPDLSPTVSIGRESSPRRLLEYITRKITLHHSDPSLDGLTYWRERILSVVLTAGCGLSLLALVPAIFLAFTRQLWVLLISDGVALLLVGFLLFASHRDLRFRAMLTLSVTFMVGVIIIHQIGFLSGGTAWLFCFSVLAGIVSYPDLLLLDLPADSPLRRPIETIQESGKRAAAIVQDLLTLARRGVSVSEVVKLNEVVREYLTSPEFQRLKAFHPLVTVTTRVEPGLLNILGSPVHLSKTIMNLVSNAAEAMPEGGEILVASSNTYLDRPVSGYAEVREGEYAVLQVVDTGIGISAEDIHRIFEPF